MEIERARFLVSTEGHEALTDPAVQSLPTGDPVRLATELRKASQRGFEVALLCDASLRRAMRHSLVRALAEMVVVSYQEIPNDVLMEPVAVIRPEDLTPTGPSAVGAMFEQRG